MRITYANRTSVTSKKLANLLEREGFVIADFIGNSGKEMLFPERENYTIQDPSHSEKKGRFFGFFNKKVCEIGCVHQHESDVTVQVYGREYLERIKSVVEGLSQESETPFNVILQSNESRIHYVDNG